MSKKSASPFDQPPAEPVFLTSPVSNITDVELGLTVGGIRIEDTHLLPDRFETIVNLRRIPIDYRLEKKKCLKRVIWSPIADGDHVSREWLDTLVKAIQAALRGGHRVLIHCMEGRSRGPFVTAAVLMSTYGFSRDKALASIAKLRPIVDPAPVYYSVLEDYETFLRGS